MFKRRIRIMKLTKAFLTAFSVAPRQPLQHRDTTMMTSTTTPLRIQKPRRKSPHIRKPSRKSAFVSSNSMRPSWHTGVRLPISRAHIIPISAVAIMPQPIHMPCPVPGRHVMSMNITAVGSMRHLHRRVIPLLWTTISHIHGV